MKNFLFLIKRSINNVVKNSGIFLYEVEILWMENIQFRKLDDGNIIPILIGKIV